MSTSQFNNDLSSIGRFLDSDDGALRIEYKKNDEYYLKYFCALLGHSFKSIVCRFIYLLQRILYFSGPKIALYRMVGVKIGHNVYLGPHVVFDPYFPFLVEVGDNAILGIDVRIAAHEISRNTLTLGRIKIGNGAVIGAYSLIKNGVSIGSNTEIGMGSVIYRDVPAGSSAIGNPARAINP